MTRFGEPIIADELPQGSNYDPIPAGWYEARIFSADLAPTRAGTGELIKFRMDVTGPTHEGRVVFANVNMKNPSAEAERIGRGQFGDIMRALGIPKADDTDDLVGGELSIKVSIRKSEQWGDKNEIQGYKAIVGSQAPGTDITPKPSDNGKAKDRSSPPWAK